MAGAAGSMGAALLPDFEGDCWFEVPEHWVDAYGEQYRGMKLCIAGITNPDTGAIECPESQRVGGATYAPVHYCIDPPWPPPAPPTPPAKPPPPPSPPSPPSPPGYPPPLPFCGYTVIPTAMTANQAFAMCYAMGAVPAAVSSWTQNNALLAEIKLAGGGRAYQTWLGGKEAYSSIEGSYYWIHDGTTIPQGSSSGFWERWAVDRSSACGTSSSSQSVNCRGESSGNPGKMLRLQDPDVTHPSARYENWKSGEPNRNGDNMRMRSNGQWEDALERWQAWVACMGLCPPSAPPSVPPAPPPAPPSAPCQDMVITLYNPSMTNWDNVWIELDGTIFDLTDSEGRADATASLCRVPGCYSFRIVGTTPGQGPGTAELPSPLHWYITALQDEKRLRQGIGGLEDALACWEYPPPSPPPSPDAPPVPLPPAPADGFSPPPPGAPPPPSAPPPPPGTPPQPSWPPVPNDFKEPQPPPPAPPAPSSPPAAPPAPPPCEKCVDIVPAFYADCAAMQADGCPAWAVSFYCRVTCGECVPCSPPPSPPMSPPSAPLPPTQPPPPAPPAPPPQPPPAVPAAPPPSMPPSAPRCEADPLGLSAGLASGSTPQPQCFVDSNGKPRCVVLRAGQSICDEAVERRLTKLWGAGVAAGVVEER